MVYSEGLKCHKPSVNYPEKLKMSKENAEETECVCLNIKSVSSMNRCHVYGKVNLLCFFFQFNFNIFISDYLCHVQFI